MAKNGYSKFFLTIFPKKTGRNLEQPKNKIICTEKLSEKIWNSHFGHSEFIPVFLGKIVRKNLEWPFLAIPNLHQSFWEKLSEKLWNGHFWPNLYQFFGKNCQKKFTEQSFWLFQIYTSLFGENCQKKFGMAIFGHSEFILVFLGKIVGKIWNGHFWPFWIYTSLSGKNCQKKFRMPIPNLYQSFWEKLSEKILECHSKFIPVFLGKIVRKNSECHFWPFWIYTSLFGKNCQQKFGMAIFGHSELIPVFLGKIVRKKLEQSFLAVPNLYQSFWEKLSEKNFKWPFLAILNLYLVFLGKIVRKNLKQPFLAILNFFW